MLNDTRAFLTEAFVRAERSPPFRDALALAAGDAARVDAPLVALGSRARLVATLELLHHAPSEARATGLIQALIDDPAVEGPAARLEPTAPAFVEQALLVAVRWAHPFSAFALADMVHMPEALLGAVSRAVALGDSERLGRLRDTIDTFRERDLQGFGAVCALITMALAEPDRDERLRAIVRNSGLHFMDTVAVLVRGRGPVDPVAPDHPAVVQVVDWLGHRDHSFAAAEFVALVGDRDPDVWLDRGEALARRLQAREDAISPALWLAVAGVAERAGQPDRRALAARAMADALAALGSPGSAEGGLIAALGRHPRALDDAQLRQLAGRHFLGDTVRARIVRHITDRDPARDGLPGVPGSLIGGRARDVVALHLYDGDWRAALAVCAERDGYPDGATITEAREALPDEGVAAIVDFVAGRTTVSDDTEVARSLLLHALIAEARRRRRPAWVPELRAAADRLDSADFRARALTDIATLLEGAARVELVEAAFVPGSAGMPWSSSDHALADARSLGQAGDPSRAVAVLRRRLDEFVRWDERKRLLRLVRDYLAAVDDDTRRGAVRDLHGWLVALPDHELAHRHLPSDPNDEDGAAPYASHLGRLYAALPGGEAESLLAELGPAARPVAEAARSATHEATSAAPDPLADAVRAGDVAAAKKLARAIKGGLARATRVAELIPEAAPAVGAALVEVAVRAPKSGLKKHEVIARDAQVARAIIGLGDAEWAAALRERVAVVARSHESDALRGIVRAFARQPSLLGVEDAVAVASSPAFLADLYALELYPLLPTAGREALRAALPSADQARDLAAFLAPRAVAAFRAGEPWRDALSEADAYMRTSHRSPRGPSFLAMERLLETLVDDGDRPYRSELLSGLLPLVLPPPTRDRGAYAPLAEAVARMGEYAAWTSISDAYPGRGGDDALLVWIRTAPFFAARPVAALEAVREACLRQVPLARAWVAWLAIALQLERRFDDAEGLYALARSEPPFET